MTVLSDLSYLTLCVCHLELKESSDASFHVFATGDKGLDAQKEMTGISVIRSYRCSICILIVDGLLKCYVNDQ